MNHGKCRYSAVFHRCSCKVFFFLYMCDFFSLSNDKKAQLSPGYRLKIVWNVSFIVHIFFLLFSQMPYSLWHFLSYRVFDMYYQYGYGVVNMSPTKALMAESYSFSGFVAPSILFPQGRSKDKKYRQKYRCR